MIQSAIKAILPYAGGKRTLAPRIARELGDRHRSYVEPFCGSLAVLFAKKPCAQELVSDLNGLVTNLARVIANEAAAKRLFDRCRRTLMCEGIFEECKAEMPDPTNPASDFARSVESVEPIHEDIAWRTLVVSFIGRNGTAGTDDYNWSIARRYTSKGGQAGTRWGSVAESIPGWYERLRKVEIRNDDAIELCFRIEDEPHVAIYCDPPYLGKGFKYVHDFDPQQHRTLAWVLNLKRHARIVVSYYDHPLLEELYPPGKWTKVHAPIAKALAQQSKRGSKKVEAPEVLLINGPSYTAGEQDQHLFSAPPSPTSSSAPSVSSVLNPKETTER